MPVAVVCLFFNLIFPWTFLFTFSSRCDPCNDSVLVMGEHVGHLSQLTFAASVVWDHYKRLKVQKKGVASIATCCVFCAGSTIDCCLELYFQL